MVVRITTKEPLRSVPPNFAIATPPRIAFDFPNTANALGRANQDIGQGELRSMNVVQGAERTRLVLNLRRSVVHEATRRRPHAGRHAAGAGAAARHARRPGGAFRRGPRRRPSTPCATSTSGAGAPAKAASWSTCPTPPPASTSALQGQNIVVDFLKTALPENLRRRLDVVDFATPVSTVSAFQQGENVRMVIEPKGQWEHNAYQSDTAVRRRGEAGRGRPVARGAARPLHRREAVAQLPERGSARGAAT